MNKVNDICHVSLPLGEEVDQLFSNSLKPSYDIKDASLKISPRVGEFFYIG